MPEATQVPRKLGRKEAASCLMLELEQMVSSCLGSWERGPGLATSLEEDTFCFPWGECGKLSLSGASQSSFLCKRWVCKGVEPGWGGGFVVCLENRREVTHISCSAPGRAECRKVKSACTSDLLCGLTRLAGGNLLGHSFHTGTRCAFNSVRERGRARGLLQARLRMVRLAWSFLWGALTLLASNLTAPSTSQPSSLPGCLAC